MVKMLAIHTGLDDGKVVSTPPSSLSPYPYKRRGFLRRKSAPPTARAFDVGVDSIIRRGSTGTRPLPRTPSDNLLHDSVGINGYATPGSTFTNEMCGSRDSPMRDSRRGSAPSSRSASPNKRPWYPAGCRPSSGESGRNGSDDHESTYVVHPTFRHLFDKTANGSDAGGARGQNDRGVCGGGGGVDGRLLRQHRIAVPDAGVGGSPHPSPQTATTAPPRSETDRKARSATGERRRKTANAHLSTKQKNIADNKRQDKPTGSRLTPNDRLPRRKVRNEGRFIEKREGHQHDVYREPVAMVRDRVRDLQSRGKPRSQQNGLSVDDRGRVGPVFPSSAVFTGHSEQVLALAQHKDVMFSAAADGTAKVSVLFSRTDVFGSGGLRLRPE